MFVFLAVPADLATLTVAGSTPRPGHRQFLAGCSSARPARRSLAATKALIGAAAASLYYWRFRLPFALLPIAASLVLRRYGFGHAGRRDRCLPVVSVDHHAGMRTHGLCRRDDIRHVRPRPHDAPLRLRVLAASSGGAADRAFADFADHAEASLRSRNTIALAILLIVAVLAVVAIAIDRRALAGIGAGLYRHRDRLCRHGCWTGRAARRRAAIFFTTLVILGAFVITLGVGWQPLRRRLLALISPSIASKLPPVPKSA